MGRNVHPKFCCFVKYFSKLWIITKKGDKSIGYEIIAGLSVTLWKILTLAFYHRHKSYMVM